MGINHDGHGGKISGNRGSIKQQVIAAGTPQCSGGLLRSRPGLPWMQSVGRERFGKIDQLSLAGVLSSTEP